MALNQHFEAVLWYNKQVIKRRVQSMKSLEDMTREELIKAYIEREKELCSKIESKHKQQQKLVEHKQKLADENKKLNADKNKLNNKVKKLGNEIKERKQELIEKNEYIKLLENVIYSSQRNKVPEFNQGPTLFSLLEDSEMTPEIKELIKEDDKQETKVTAYTRKKRAKKESHINYEHLKQDVVVVKTPEGFDICDKCGTKMEIKKYIERKELVYKPASLVMRIYRMPVYECKECQCSNIEGKSSYKTVAGSNPLIKGSVASASLVAHIMDMKFLKGLPLYAQEKAFLEHQLILPRQNMVNWLEKTAKMLNPLYNLMKKDLLSMDVIHSDETPTVTLKEEKSKNAYMWVLRSNKYDDQIVLYHYAPSRAKEVITNLIGSYNKYVVSDAYSVYDSLEGVTNVFCHVHAFRYIRDALEVLPKGADKTKTPEYKSYRYYQKVFDENKKIEKEALDKYEKDNEKIIKYIEKQRNNRVKPLYTKFLEYLKTESCKMEVMIKPTYMKAVNYILNHEKEFMEVFNYGKLPLDNSAAERVIRPFAVNKHRCRFYVSPEGAGGAAVIYSILLTAQENKLSGYMYMKYILEILPNIDLENEVELRKLLPYNKELPSYLRQLTKNEIQKLLKDKPASNNK